MSGPVAELDGILQSMLNLKPPGVTGGKIQSVTALCNNNVQSETVLIQRIYTHFKKAPPTHKLGVLYVVDSVTRAWVEQARKSGQALGLNEHPSDGTYAAGHKRVAELLPSFMNDIINSAPEDQKARISKLIDIWERGGTFPTDMLNSFRQKMASAVAKTTTPPGSPPKDFNSLNANGNTANPPQNTSSILQALANMVKTNSNGPEQSAAVPDAASAAANLQNAYSQGLPPSVNSSAPAPPFAQVVSALGNAGGANGLSSYGGGMGNLANFGQALPQPQSGQINLQANPAAPPGAAVPSPEQLQQQIQIIQVLQSQGIPPEQWGPVMSALMAAGGGAAAGSSSSAAPPPQQQAWPPPANPYPTTTGGDPYGMRSPPGRNRRSRSRSPSGYDRRRDGSPRTRRRDSPTYGAYGRNDDRGDRYRQRSPDRYRRSPSPDRSGGIPPPGPKSITWDNTMPPDHIKVLSRTLFVGGVTSPESVLRGVFAAFGVVQTCIVNIDKRHAFVKMISRDDAVSAKEGMERSKNSQDMQLRTRWGVGFGPRDCSDYATGISIIPIHKLTDADRKWMATAEYGGTGGRKLEGGMVVEEPDIEIGAGVSSKAISRRMGTDKGGPQGPRSSRDNQPNQHNDRQRHRDDDGRHNNHNNGNNNNNNNNASSNANAGMPNLPGFPMNFPQMPNGFQFPPGFIFPGATPAPGQPPPPGAS